MMQYVYIPMMCFYWNILKEKLNEATNYLLKAINVAKKSKMYANVFAIPSFTLSDVV